jgi:RimJ/RimL family protein N-acetyltransferase
VSVTYYNSKLIKIRRYEISDACKHYEAVCESRDDLKRHFSWCHDDYSLEESEKFMLRTCSDWKSGQQYHFAIVDSKSDDFLGSCSLQNRGVWWMNYWVRSKKSGHGIAKAAVIQLKDWAFGNLKPDKIHIRVAKCNEKSRHVAQSITKLFPQDDKDDNRYVIYTVQQKLNC